MSRLLKCANERLPFYNFVRMVYSLDGLARDDLAIIKESVEEQPGSREVAGDPTPEQET